MIGSPIVDHHPNSLSCCMDPVALSNQYSVHRSTSNTFGNFNHKCSFFQNSCDSTCNTSKQNLSSCRRRSYTSPERSATPVKELVKYSYFVIYNEFVLFSQTVCVLLGLSVFFVNMNAESLFQNVRIQIGKFPFCDFWSNSF